MPQPISVLQTANARLVSEREIFVPLTTPGALSSNGQHGFICMPTHSRTATPRTRSDILLVDLRILGGLESALGLCPARVRTR